MMRASVSAVRRLYGNRKPFGGWAGFKHRLHQAGVLNSPTADVPEAWKQAFCKACGRDYPAK